MISLDLRNAKLNEDLKKWQEKVNEAHRQLHEKQEAESSFFKKKILIHWIMGDKIMKNFPPKP